ncbi:hypothetical protein GQ607_009633 [Colletotrichum asianum]|uniref:DUF7580 domain-containing protein n=1 Tax=Colletotrichum asianum TaxID=702518 RepID=A0A8H3W9P8_9PEZI|nr:hypothetical protein GQ607_009633 [Colletotrichum asianum]
MAELALGVVGIVPLVGGAIKAYKEVNRRLKLFRHSSREVKNVFKLVKIQRQIFSNECCLWLRFALEDGDIISEMASDPGHDGWKDPSLDESLRSRLKENYSVWVDIIAGISVTIHNLETDLTSFEESSDTKNSNRKLKRSLKRTKDGVKIAVKASDFESTIGKLRVCNNDLKRLREQIGEIFRPSSHCSIPSRASKRGDWAGLIRIRRASKALHEALVRAWNCGQPGHAGHVVKLFVEASKVDGEVRMNLAIVYRNRSMDLLHSTLVELEVRSQNLEWMDERKLYRQLPPPDDEGVAPQKRRLKVVRFSETTVQRRMQNREGNATITCERGATGGSCDLGSSKDICRELTQQLTASCLGHIDVQSDEGFRHSFYPAKDGFCSGAPRSPSLSNDAVRMDEVLDDASRNSFSTVNRLKLARSLVSAVLKFHSTPWLGDFWRLRDLGFFQTSKDEEVSKALRTLHLGVEVFQKQLGSMEGVQTSAECSDKVSEDDRLFCGIGNLTLHSLGVALLQIDRWARVEPGDILKVRKMALRPSSLGPRYQEITQKCLRCDFGYGSDLMKPRLQEAVYENVVGTLEKMISSLDLADD